MSSYLPFIEILPYKTSMNPLYVIPIAALIGIVIILKIYMTWKETRNATKFKKSSLHKAYSSTLRFDQPSEGASKKELRLVSKLLSFTPEQSEFFTKLCKRNKIMRPAQFIENKIETDEVFNKTLRLFEEVDPSTREIERNKLLLFRIRESIDNKRKAGSLISSSRVLKPGQGFTLTVSSGEKYQSAITDNRNQGLICLIPRDLFGNELRLPLKAKLDVFFIESSGQSYRVTTRVLQYISHRSGTSILLSHSDSISALPNRKHDRRSFDCPCTFCHVSVANVVNGRHTEHKFFPAEKKFSGTIQDISAGGCTIITAEQLPIGEYIQIQCIIEKDFNDTIIGKVVRISGEPEKTEVQMHIKFAKMPRATMNRIFTIIYNREGVR